MFTAVRTAARVVATTCMQWRKASTCCDEDCPDEEDVHLHLFIWNGSAKKGRQGGGAGEGMGGVETERKFAPKKHQNTPPLNKNVNKGRKCP